jgi:allene oxide cyclase
MRAAIVIAAAVVAAGLTAAGATAAAANTAGTLSHSGHQHRPAPLKFTVVEHAVTDTTTDTGAKGDSVGDLLTFANPVFDAANKKQLGSDNGYCLRTKAGAAYECNWTLALAGGSLVVEGPFYDTKDSVLAITGGTGKWASARGQMTLHARNAAGSSYDFGYTVNH